MKDTSWHIFSITEQLATFLARSRGF